jgi:NADH dehydrogenase ubiquinone Fe-S protein 4
MVARIFRPAKTAMQSGRAKVHEWVLEFEPDAPRQIDPLMGWTSATDMLAEVHLAFETKDQAIAYAQKEGIPYQVFEAHDRRPKPKSYADNFRYDRKRPWSH